jgi:uncharacterized protein (DUF58 family)
MGKILDRQFLEMLKTITLHIQLSLKSGNLGNKRSKAIGSSVEFSDYREYLPGDDFRRIDWNAYARFERVFIKLFMQEQESPVTIFLDTSDSMKDHNKRETAVKVAGTFSYVALSDYDTVSLALFNEGVQDSLMNLRGTSSFNRVISTLEDHTFKGQSDLYASVFKWQAKFRKGITIIVSDLMYDHQLDKLIRLLSFHKQKVILCHILSQEELSPVFDENVRIIDSETKEYMDINTGIEAINLYKKKLSEYFKEIKTICSKYGVDYMLVNTAQPIEGFMKHIQSIT